eukprot:Seg2722.2 transcript_id=Seg2722.2/GoldUCD/mRNA.D3Y31 product="Beta-1 3-galactosyltransferase 1" protein_id=Seg2722.2/GoldUCD/D3Y31
MLWWYSGNKVNHERSGNIYDGTENKLHNIPENLKKRGSYPFNKILIEPELLPNKLLFAAIISSASTTLKSRKRRDAIRKTWGNCHSEQLQEKLFGRNYYHRKSEGDTGIIKYKHCRILFYVGQTGVKEKDNEIRREASIYKDLIVVDTVESYRNVTWKLRTAFEYISHFDVKYIVKSDDDVYINLPRLAKYLTKSTSLPATIYGGFTYTGTVVRDTSHRHFVAMSDFADYYYPLFCKGSMVILSGNLIKPLVNALTNVKPFNIDDAYLGITLNKMGISPTKLDKIVQFQHLPVFLDYLQLCDFSWLVGIGDGLDATKIFSVHEAMMQGENLPTWMCWHLSLCHFMLFSISLGCCYAIAKRDVVGRKFR